MKRASLACLAAALLLAACGTNAPVLRAAPDQRTAPQLLASTSETHEGASGYTDKPGWATREFAVAAAHPLAAEAGVRMIQAGGTAIDAAVAVQMVLGLVEPQSSGIGGGAFLLHHDGRKVEAYDGRETAPAAADERLFLGADGQPLSFPQAAIGGRAVGVPGVVRMLELAHGQHGKLPWSALFAPAIQLAEDGFPVGARLHALLQADSQLRRDPVAAAYFYRADGEPHDIGHRLRNPEYAAVLRRIASDGSKALHEGPVAEAIVRKVRAHATNPGRMTMTDLAQYRAVQRDPLCRDHRGAARFYRICGFPPPSSGAIAIAQILGILAHTNAANLPPIAGIGAVPGATSLAPSAPWLHLYTEAARLAFADRAQFVADPDFVQPPAGGWDSLLEAGYLLGRSRLIGAQSMNLARPGNPGGTRSSHAPMAPQPESGTSHISIVDDDGNALALTTTIESGFGARQMVSVEGGIGGFLLNNQLTDFSFEPRGADGRPIANRVEGGKRPRSSMAPTLVFDRRSGGLVMTGGSPGGAMIIHYTAKTLYGVLNWGLSVQQAIDLPNFGSLNGPTLLEDKRFPRAEVEALRARGAELRELPLTSGIHAIQAMPDGWFGGADPRREGVVQGQ